MEEHTKFEDGESYSYNKSEGLSFREIILQHLKLISRNYSVELRGGYWEEKPNPIPNSNEVIRIYVPDTREVYSNSVEALADMLLPYFDEEMKKSEAECIKLLKQYYETCTSEKTANTEKEFTKAKRSFKTIEDKMSYRSLRVKVCRKLFRALCCFLHRKRYLEVGSLED